MACEHCDHEYSDRPAKNEDKSTAEKGSFSPLTRRAFIQSAALAAGSGLVLREGILPPTLYAASLGVHGILCVTPERIAAAPTFQYRPYRSKAVNSVDTVSWVQIDLGESRAIDEVQLFPANQRSTPGADAHYAGEGFPLRFKLEWANDPEFSKPEMILDQSQKDFDNPKDRIVSISNLKGRARYIRLTVTKFPSPEWTRSVVDAPEAIPAATAKNRHWFALSRIAVLAGGNNVAIGHHVSGDGIHSNAEDLQQLTRPDRLDSEYVYRDRPDYVTDASHWRKDAYKAQSPLSGVTLHGGIFETAMRRNITYLLDSFTVDDLLLQFRERAGKPVPPGSKAQSKFWDSDLAGSNAGRFLMGSGNTLRWIDDPELRRRFHEVIRGIAECKEPDGYCMA